MDDALVLKIVLLIFMGVVPLIFGLLPLKILNYFARRKNDSKDAHTLFSVFSCFAAGVILGVSLIELFPEAREGASQLIKDNQNYGDYPLVELFVGIGFLLVYFIEEFMTIIFGHEHTHHGHHHSNQSDDALYQARRTISKLCISNEAMCSDSINESHGNIYNNSTFNGKTLHAPLSVSIITQDYESMTPRYVANRSNAINELDSPTSRLSSDESNVVNENEFGSAAHITTSFHKKALMPIMNTRVVENELESVADIHYDDCGGEEDRRKSIIGAITLVVALFLHTSLEGFAFGIQKETVSVSSLFFGIVVHKIVVFFSVGINLTQALPLNPRVVIVLITLLATFSPVGAIVGMIVESLEMDGNIKGIVSTILICMSIGTFIYIALFEILSPERHKPVPRLLQWFGCAFGFAIMCIVLSLSRHVHPHGSLETTYSHNHDHNTM